MGKNGYRIVGGKLARKRGRLDFTVDERLKCGEYLLRITLCDKAKNTSESKYSFVVPEDEILTISARYEEYEESKHKALVPAVLRDGVVPSGDRLYVYYVNLHNRAQRTYCRSLYVTIDIEGVIWRWEETGSADCKGVVSASTPESMIKNLPKDRVFGSQEMLRIEEMAPGGLVNFRVLVGFFNTDGHRPALITPTQIEVFGTYVSDGYRRTTTVDVRREIPILPKED